MFWNAGKKGIRDRRAQLLAFLVNNKVDAAFIMETHIYKEGRALEQYKWLPGPENEKTTAQKQPSRGQGAFISDKVATGAAVVHKGKNSMWVRLTGATTPLYICATHVPLDKVGRTVTLREIKKGYDKVRYKGGQVIIGGDFNARCGMNGDTVRNTAGNEVLQFCAEPEHCFTVVNSLQLCEGQFTTKRILKGKKVHTTIDYCLVPQEVQDKVSKLQLVEHSGLESDHYPLLLDLDWQHGGGGRGGRAPRADRVRYKIHDMSDADWNEYEDVLEDTVVPVVSEALDDIEEMEADGMGIPRVTKQEIGDKLCSTLTEAVRIAASQAVGVKKQRADTKPWFDPEMRQVYQQCKSAQAQLCAARKQGDHATIVRALGKARWAGRRAKAVARSKRQRAQRRDARIIERWARKSKLWWAARKSHARKRQGGQSQLDSVRDKDGKLVTQVVGVLKVWRDYVYTLGKEDQIPDEVDEDSSASPFDDLFAKLVQRQLREADQLKRVGVREIDRPISFDEVHDTFRHLPNGKAAGPDGIPAELIRHGGIAFETAALILFNYLWQYQVWPTGWREAILFPLFKNRGVRINPGDYRLIAVMPVLAKAFEKILDTRLRDWAERVGMLSDLQGGFRSFRSTLDQMFILNEAIAMAQEQKAALYMTFIDVKKAYDRVWRSGLWHTLMTKGVSPHIRGMIRRIYESVLRRVLIGDQLTEPVSVETGVAQGAVLSPLLYATYIDGLHEALRKERLGIWIAGRLVPLLMYADDIVLLAPSEAMMRRMLEVVTQYAKQRRFEVNHGKSNLVVVGPAHLREHARATSWTLSGCPIDIKDSYRYLGAEVEAAGRKWQQLKQRLQDKGASYVNQLLWQGYGAWGFNPSTYTKLWKAEGRVKMEYACELWEGELRTKDESELESVQYKFAKAALGIPAEMKPAAVGTRMELGLLPLKLRRQALKLLYWERLCHSSPDRLVSMVFRSRHREALAQRGAKSWFTAMRDLMDDWGLSHYFQSGTAEPRTQWKERIWSLYEKKGAAANAADVSDKSSLAVYRRVAPPSFDLATCLLDRANKWGSLTQTRLRLGLAPLLARLHSLLKLPPEDALCPLCQGDRDDTYHIIGACPVFARERRHLQQQVRSNMACLGEPGAAILSQLQDDPEVWFDTVLGAYRSIDIPNGLTGTEIHQFKMLAAKTLWSLDKSVKNFLLVLWKKRRALVGDLTIADGRIVRNDPPPATRQWYRRYQRSLRSSLPKVELHDNSVREFWEPWMSCLRDPHLKDYKKNRRKNYFRVWMGHTRGVFYKWSDCKTAITGYNNPKFKGFPTLEKAIFASDFH